MALTNLINVTHAKWQYVKRTLIFIVKMPYNGIVKNAHEDIKSGGANFFWKYPLILSMCCYPVPFYYHENGRVNERRHLQALGIKTQYAIDVANGMYPPEDC